MPRFRRHRSSSEGSYPEGSGASSMDGRAHASITTAAQDWGTAKQLLHSLLYLKDAQGKGFLHSSFPNDLYLAKCLLDRCRAVDDRDDDTAKKSSSSSRKKLTSSQASSWQNRFLLQPTLESGYTPLHAAIGAGDLAAILLYLQYPRNLESSLSFPAVVHKPMMVLQSGLTEGARAVDAEGLTPIALLGKLQISRLRQCRAQLLPTTAKKLLLEATSSNTSRREQQQPGGGIMFDHRLNEELPLDLLREPMPLFGAVRDQDEGELHAFEVVTFGRPHHCALGVISSSGGSHHCHDDKTSNSKQNNNSTPIVAAVSFRPQRVQEFAQERVLREGSAVAVAAAAHHTLVACRNGHLYVFGLNKGGRLGLGDDCPQQCPLPSRIHGPLKRKHVIAIAAAENHSLCVTSDGMVWAWGSNQFGQLGDSPGNNNSGGGCGGGATNSSRSLPKPVEELKKISCVAVAAGEKHSVALSERGEVYVWGSNASGQLGVARRSAIQKVQRVETLWNSESSSSSHHRGLAIAIAAADQSTLVLTAPVPGLSPVNSVFWWGHGNHVPMRVQFDNNTSNPQSMSTLDFDSMTKSQRLINPVAIACAKYHNAAVTSDGCVYTWGTSSESLGRGASGKTSPGTTTRSSSSGSHRATASPQLVTGMLPENGGGFAVSVSASEQHTAVVTDTGALFTWGVAHGKNVMGHEGVRWQPSPKRVPGVHRAVSVAVAKEHTVVLIGTTFPPIPPARGMCSLESLSARTVARYVDLFNVIPILIMAEQTQSELLVEYCTDFVRKNLDGVLNVGKKDAMNQYLNDMLSQSFFHSERKFRDDHYHPFISDVITAGNMARPTFHQEWLSTTEDWVSACQHLSQSPGTKSILEFSAIQEYEEELARAAKGRGRRSSSITNEHDGLILRNRAISYGSEQDGAPKQEPPAEGVLDTLINKTAKMDLSTSELAHENSRWLEKEIRGVRKKLSQIAKLRESEAKSIVLTTAEQSKVDRRPVLEAELHVYETALEEVEKRIRELLLEDQQKCVQSTDSLAEVEPSNAKGFAAKLETMKEEEESCDSTYACEMCGIKCPDKTSFELHQNGRKHRNRLAQVAEEEKQKAAEAIMAQRQLELVKSPTATPPSVKKIKKNAWGTTTTPQPKFILPPPPHPVVAPVPTPRKTTPSNISPVFPEMASPPLPSPVTHFPSMLPVGQQHLSQKKNSPKPTSPFLNAATSHKKNSPKPTSPFLKAPIWTTASGSAASAGSNNHGSPFQLHAVPAADGTALASSTAGQRNSYSLSDFLAPKAPPPQPPIRAPASNKVASNKAAWGSARSSPSANTISNTLIPKMVAPLVTAVKTKSLAEIQAEEVEFKSRQDKLYVAAGGDRRGAGETSWFILERRERADSLHAIQEAAAKERETERMIQEQLAIEAQIHQELAAQKEEQKKKAATTPNGVRLKKKNTRRKDPQASAPNSSSELQEADLQNSSELTKRPASTKRQQNKKGPKKCHEGNPSPARNVS